MQPGVRWLMRAFVEPRPTRAHTVRAMLIVAAAYYIGARIGLALTMRQHPVSTLWPPNAILLAALLLSPVRIWWLLLLAALPAHLAGELAEGIPLTMVLCWFISNVSEALIGAGAIRLLQRSPRLDSFRRVVIFLGAGVFLAPLLSSFLDAAFVIWNGLGVAGYWEVWRTRFLSNALATVALVPLIIQASTIRLDELRTIPWRRYLEAGVLTLSLLATCVGVFTRVSPADMSTALLYAPFPFLVWAAVRFGPGGSSASVLVMALFAISAAIHGQRPFDALSPSVNTSSVRLFLLVTSIPLLTLGAVMAERRRAEQALRSSEERFAVAFRSGPDAFAITRRSDGHIVDLNERWQSMFGHARSEAIGRSPAELDLFLHAEDADRFNTHISSHGHAREIELPLRSRYGAVLRGVVTAQSVTMADEPCFLIIIRDVTERRQAEEELLTQRAELAHLSRVALLGELSAALAHELNQPLAAIMANARAGQRLMMRKPPDISEVRSIFEDIVADDHRAGEVIRRLHALLERGELQLQALDVNEIVKEVVELVHSELIRREVSVHPVLAPSLPAVTADRVQVQQVLMNLIMNACEAMGEQPREERRATIITSPSPQGGVRISVVDRGTGIPDGHLERVFEPFFTSKRHGLGLGLAICRTIVAAHDGRLWAVNNADRGVTFHLVLQPAGHAAD